MIFGGIFLYFLAPEAWGYGRALSWTEESCLILTSKVQRITDPGWNSEVKPVHYQTFITYSYSRNDRLYASSKYSLINPSPSCTRAGEIVFNYSVGAKKTCFVNPHKPDEAVLNRTINAFSMAILVPLPFFLLGIWGMFKFIANLSSLQILYDGSFKRSKSLVLWI